MNRSPGGTGTTTRPGRPPAPRQAPDRATRQRSSDRFVRDLVSEMRRVTWPTRPEWVSATVLTIALVVFVGLYTYLIDQLFGLIFGLIHR